MAEGKGLTYPAQLYADIFAGVQLDHTKKALEIGIGMGQATGPILETGCYLTAVEQDEKMVEICKAVSHDCKLLVLDEPFRGLDEATKEQVMEAVRRRTAGRTVFMVTHDEDEARAMSANLTRL